MSFKLRQIPPAELKEEIDDWQQDTFQRLSGSDISPHYIDNLGSWNMLANAQLVYSPATLNVKSINNISLVILKDDGTGSKIGSFGTGISDIDIDYTANTITITRLGGGVYDSTDYDNAAINRGRIGIWT